MSLQKLYRGRVGRRLFLAITKAKRERQAATRIQAITRGKWGRQRAERYGAGSKCIRPGGWGVHEGFCYICCHLLPFASRGKEERVLKLLKPTAQTGFSQNSCSKQLLTTRGLSGGGLNFLRFLSKAFVVFMYRSCAQRRAAAPAANADKSACCCFDRARLTNPPLHASRKRKRGWISGGIYTQPRPKDS